MAMMKRAAVVVLVLAACGPGGKRAALGNQPAPGAAVTLAYVRDAFVGRWHLESTAQTTSGSQYAMDVTAFIDLRFEAGQPGQLRVFVERVALNGTAGGRPIEIDLNKDTPDVIDAFSTPLQTMELSARGPRGGASDPRNPMAAQGTGFLESVAFMIPELPAGPVAVGATWTASRVVPKASNAGPPVSADVHFRLDALAPCPDRPTARCARIAFSADTGARDLEVAGATSHVHYQFDGAGVVELGGALLSSRSTMTFTIATGGTTMIGGGTITYAPR